MFCSYWLHVQKIEINRALNAVTDFGEIIIQDYNQWNIFLATNDNGKVVYKYIPPDKHDYLEGINSIYAQHSVSYNV